MMIDRSDRIRESIGPFVKFPTVQQRQLAQNLGPRG